MVLSIRTSEREPRSINSITISISCPPCSRQHAEVYVSRCRIRQHTPAYVTCSERESESACVSIRQQTSAYVAYVSISQHKSAYITCVSIRQQTSHTSAYVSIRHLRRARVGDSQKLHDVGVVQLRENGFEGVSRKLGTA